MLKLIQFLEYFAHMEVVKEYENTEECAKDLKVSKTNIYNCCNGKQKSCKGYILKYKN